MTRIDPRVPRLNQAIVGVGALVAFLLDAAWLLVPLALLLAAGALLGPAASPVALLWRRVVIPAFRLAPRATKEAAPVRFAQLVGLVFLVAASALVLGGVAPALGWALALVVAALALLAAITDVCVGCEAYVLVRKWTARAERA